MNDRDGDLTMLGVIVGLLMFGACVASCCSVPRGPDRCCAVDTFYDHGGKR